MKRKLALLLAGVMTLAAVPMNLFAADNTTGKIVTNAVNASAYTLFYEKGAVKGSTSQPVSDTVKGNSSTLEYYTQGPYLEWELERDIDIANLNTGDGRLRPIMSIELGDAEWFFRQPEATAADISSQNFGHLAAGSLSGKNFKDLPDAEKELVLEELVAFLGIKDTDAQVITNLLLVEEIVNRIRIHDNTGNSGFDLSLAADSSTTRYSGQGLPTEKINGSDVLNRTYNRHNGVMLSRYAYLGFGSSRAGKEGDNELVYLLEVSQTNDSQAQIYLLESGDEKTSSNRGDILSIPLVSRSKTDSGDIIANVTNSLSYGYIKEQRFIYASSGAGKTSTAMKSVVTGRDDINIGDLVISERRAGSLRNGTFEIVAPSGYHWDFNENYKVSGSDVVSSGLWVEGGDLSWASNYRGGYQGTGNSNHGRFETTPLGGDSQVGGTYGNAYSMGYKRSGTSSNYNYVDDSVWQVTLHHLQQSTDTSGRLYIRGLLLISDDYVEDVTEGDLIAKIRNVSGSEVLTNEDFVVAKLSEYTLKLSRRGDDIPELISGRLENRTLRNRNRTGTGVNSWMEDGRIDDDIHKAARIRVEETLADSWWGSRNTSLVLPDGVKFLKVEFDEIKYITTTNIDMYDSYYNSHMKENNFITITDNTLTFSNLNLTTTEKSRFDLDIWINLEVDFEGDVDITLTGYNTKRGGEEDQSVTIATALVPVTVDTTVSDVKIGYQYVSVADFDITETRAGNLLRGEDVYVSVTDEIYTDLAIATGFATDVSEGDLKISNVRTANSLTTSGVGRVADGAHVKFTIDRASKNASTISFKNVQVKIDRTAPYSNPSNEDDRGINLVVWGTAIAKNYEGVAYAVSNTNNNNYSGSITFSGNNADSYDYFNTPGIRAKYVHIATSADNTYSAFTNVVSVSVGNPVITINGNEETIPVPAYVSAASNSTMVPVRFVAYALGIDEEAVVWSPNNGTVTITAGDKIVQFQIGNTNYKTNGMNIPMTSPDGLPVAPEIKDERAFVPFRALGNAFGINVGWDATTSTATYNAPTVQ